MPAVIRELLQRAIDFHCIQVRGIIVTNFNRKPALKTATDKLCANETMQVTVWCK